MIFTNECCMKIVMTSRLAEILLKNLPPVSLSPGVDGWLSRLAEVQLRQQTTLQCPPSPLQHGQILGRH